MKTLRGVLLHGGNMDNIINIMVLGYVPQMNNIELNNQGEHLVIEHGTFHCTDSLNHPGYYITGNIHLFLKFAIYDDDPNVRENQYYVIPEELLNEFNNNYAKIGNIYVTIYNETYMNDVSKLIDKYNLKKITTKEMYDNFY